MFTFMVVMIRGFSASSRRSSYGFGLHPNSPGYRLILNNVLFPQQEKKVENLV
jgi:hypothetical protein